MINLFSKKKEIKTNFDYVKTLKNPKEFINFIVANKKTLFLKCEDNDCDDCFHSDCSCGFEKWLNKEVNNEDRNN